ncbi:MAG: Mpo1-like protein [Phycisphaerae bacterium]
MPRPIQNWMSRHRNPANFWIHMAAIPMTFVVPVICLLMQRWWLAGAFFVGGYALQFVGHVVEGNRSGEEMLLRRIFAR